MSSRRIAKSIACFSLFTFALLGNFPFSVIPGANFEQIDPWQAADLPILVDGDDDWVSVPGITGDGSKDTPFIIEDMVIDAGGTGDGIMIQNTTKYFTIRNCTVTHSATMPAAGIHIYNGTNGLIEQNNCSLNGGGIFVEKNSANITIRENNATGNEMGIVIYNLSSNVTMVANNASANVWEGIDVSLNCTAVGVENNTVSNNDIEGIVLADNVTLSTFVGNNISGNGVEGLYVYETFNCTFARNLISGNQFRGVIISDYAGNNTFDENSITANVGPGLEIYLGGKNNTFTRNNITSNTGVGMILDAEGDSNLIYLNHYASNGGGNAKDDAAFNRWDNGSVGNFWHDYTGADADDNGIGDTSWLILGSAGSHDNYPIWRDTWNPVHIIGDEGWVAYRSVGNCTGSGTEIDPYIIEGRWYDAKGSTSGIWIENTSAYFIIQDCISNASAAWPHSGIRLTNVTNGQLLRNNCSVNQGPGIYLENNCSLVNITRNYAQQDLYGILAMGGSYGITINNNTITGASGMGVVLSSDHINTTLAYNNFSYNTGSGLRLVNRCTNTSIFGNIFAGNTMEGIYLSDCNFTRIEDNDARGNQIGISVDTSAQKNVIRSNRVFNNTRGFYFRACRNNTIDDNLVSNNTGDGIYIDWGTGNNSYIMNTIMQNLNGIVFASGENKNHTFFGNIVLNNSQFGIRVRNGGDGNLFYNNTLLGNNHANASDDASYNCWDNGSLGNVYGDYSGVDLNDDSIGDTEYIINGTAGAVDHYPILNDGDDAAPALAVVSPSSNQVSGLTPPFFEVTVHDLALDKTGYTLNGVNTTFTGTNGIIDSGVWDPLLNGTYILTFFANDSFDRWTTVLITILKDIEAPSFISTGFTAGQLIGNNTPSFILDALEGNPMGMWWFSFDGGAANISCSQSDFLTGWNLLPNGTVTVRFFTNDTMNNVGWIDVILLRDCAPPIISSTGLTAGMTYTSVPSINLVITEANLDSIWYSIDGGATNHTLAGLTGTIDSAGWASLSGGNVQITFWCNDTLGNSGSVSMVIVKASSSGCDSCGNLTLYWVIGGVIAIGVIVAIAIVIKKRKNRTYFPYETPDAK